MTTAPAVLADRTVIGTYRPAPLDASRRSRWPEYQPNRNASTRKELAVVDTYRRKSWPGRTLCWSAYPSIASAARRSVIRHADVPGRVFSATGNGGAALPVADGAEVGALGRAEPGPDPPVHATAASITGSATARATATPDERCIRFVVTRLTDTHHGTTARDAGSCDDSRNGGPAAPARA